MKKLLLTTLLLIAGSALAAQHPAPRPAPNYALPELHTIRTATLAPSYSCRSRADSQRGYENAALFLSDYARQRNSPDLVFNGACGSADYFHASTAGDDMALIADLGANVPLEDLSASRVFNLRRVSSFSAYTTFASDVRAQANHTYAVLINKRERRGLFVFTVVNHVPNERVEIRYAVKQYQIAQPQVRAEGFDWGAGNTVAANN